ncbi:M20/M25/M40 family metallo-hydrolase [Streptomyces radicis]|uniref:M20/M25/M40 family metallo-hydrolase n=2 Tax=Streptomyces radicis TaxID=1750517 RepID=A0A3A9W4G7_9ACTN|nr:M20/M25/M40 family metallo-hydrolase [Streptomyces radicis]RKN26873.1 M20/M25/M40 family metallo-hydrolase [Streptomyces radicis]
MRHLAAFQRIADGADGTRAAGTPGHERSARYAGELLEEAGYDVTYQRFDFPYREAVTQRLTALDPEPRDIPVRALTYTTSTPPGGVEAELAPAGTGCAAEDFDPAAHRGRIALIERGTCTFAQKEANAASAGALGALVVNNTPGALSGSLGGPDDSTIPVGGLTREDGAALADAVERGERAGETVEVRLELEEVAERRETFNVLAESPGGDPDHTVMAGAHLDSVPAGPGVNDNGSGSAGVLETALRLAEADPRGRHPHRVRFALWSAEEFGLLGSEHYVDGLSRTERDAIDVYLNFDMIGSPNHGHFVHEGTPGVAADISAFLGERGETTRPAALDGRSDYAPFVAAGIPVGGTFTGAEGIKSAADAEVWGGEAGEPHDPCYHAACDTLENVSPTALGTHAKVIAHLVGGYAWRLPE